MSRRIMVLAGFSLALFGYFVFFKDRDDMVYPLATSLIILVIAYTFQYQIDQLMIRGVPQSLDPEMRQMLLNTAPQFAAMPPAHQKLVEDRMVRWVMKKDFINKNEQDAPEDVKYILAWYFILLTIHQENYLYEGLDRIVFYHHPFLTPHHMDDAHILEVEPGDGTVIISVPHLIKGHMEKGMYNIALHAAAEAYAKCYAPSVSKWPEDIWEQLEMVSSITQQQIEAYLGLSLEDPWPVAVHHQVTYKKARVPAVLERLPQLTVMAGEETQGNL